MRKKLLLILMLSTASQAKVLLWDLGGVLFEPSKLGVAMEIGLGRIASHAFWDLSSPDISHTVFDVLTMMMPRDPSLPLISGSHSGKLLPPIMSHWQAGTITGRQIINKARVLLPHLHKFDYFESKNHMKVIMQCIRKMFDPQILSDNIYPAWEGIALLEECARMKNKDGTKKHRLFIFSNWDHLSFDIFKKKHRWIFNMFEGVVISGHIKLIKPSREAYDYIVQKYNLDPKECVMIDDQEMNTRGAILYGMQAALITDRNYPLLRKDLVRLGVLDS